LKQKTRERNAVALALRRRGFFMIYPN